MDTEDKLKIATDALRRISNILGDRTLKCPANHCETCEHEAKEAAHEARAALDELEDATSCKADFM